MNFKSKTQSKNNLNMRCLILCDLDGTLLNDSSKIGSYTTRVIKKLSKKGHIFCLATARPRRTSIKFYNMLDLKTPLINYNGARILNPSTSEFSTLNFFINTEVIRKIFTNKIIKKLYDNVMFETPDGSYFLKQVTKGRTVGQLKRELAKFNVSTTKNVNFINNDYSKLTHHGVYSALVTLNNKQKGDEFIEKITNVCPSIIAKSWTVKHLGCVIEVGSRFPTKGMALKFLSAYYDIPYSRCYAFGDNENDIKMIIKAKHGYAMKNGHERTKEVANSITKYTNNEEGVARELNRIFNLKIKYK